MLPCLRCATPPLTANYEATNFDDLSITYTVPDIADQQDLLVAVKPDVSCTLIAPVSLIFQHALSRVLLKARPAVEGTSYEIKSVAFLNLYNSGKYPVCDCQSCPVFIYLSAWMQRYY
jgi:hypothetical protein